MPDTFKSRIELMSRVELAPALLFGARRLLLQMCGWLAARHAGTTAFALRWAHDSMRSKDAGVGGELVVRTAAPMRDLEHLCRLLAEHLAKVQLLAPAGDLELEALDVHALEERSASLLSGRLNPVRDAGCRLHAEPLRATLHAMTAPITITIPHQLGRAEARRRIETGFSSMVAQLPGGGTHSERWDADRLNFSVTGMGQTISGDVEVLDAAVSMRIELPDVLGLIADGLRGRLQKAGQLLLTRE